MRCHEKPSKTSTQACASLRAMRDGTPSASAVTTNAYARCRHTPFFDKASSEYKALPDDARGASSEGTKVRQWLTSARTASAGRCAWETPIERSTSLADARAAGGKAGTLRASSAHEASPNSEPNARRA